MTDYNKRRTLKNMTLATAITSLPGLSLLTSANALASDSQTFTTALADLKSELGSQGIEFDVTIFPGDDSMEVQLRNTNAHALAVESVGPKSPGPIDPLRHLNGQLTRHGPVQLDAGESRGFLVWQPEALNA